MNPSLRAISYVLGDLRDVGELDMLRADAGLRAQVQAGGFSRYAVSDATPLDLALRAGRETLARADVDPARVDLLVVATSSLLPPAGSLRAQVVDLALSLGLVNAEPVGVFIAGCTGAAMAVKVARALLLSEGLDRALVVCADVTAPGGRRVFELGLAVLSDGAAACLVERAAPGDWEVLSVTTRSFPRLARVSVESYGFLAAHLAALREIAAVALTRAEVTGEACSRVVMNNLASSSCRLFALQVGVDAERCFFDNIARIGHCYAADPLVNLVDAQLADPLPPGALCLWLCNTETAWGAAVLRRSEPG